MRARRRLMPELESSNWRSFQTDVSSISPSFGAIRELKKLRRQLQGKRHIKTELCVKLSLCDYSMLITLYKIGGVHFRFLGTDGFHVKAKNERFSPASSCCRQNLKYENFTSSFGRLRQNIAPKSVPHVQHDYFSSFNQSNH